MSETTGLVAFLRARLDEDYKLAFEAGNGGPEHWKFDPELPWNGDNGPREAIVRFNGSALGYVAAVDPVHGKYGTWGARHIARHDPARVLAEVNAKRRILDELLDEIDERDRTYQVEYWDHFMGPYRPLTDQLLRLLALPYATHPDYRPEWAPPA
ncbi:DUF6221 family protein [Kitasatospora phosalacinea]|uniref:DUF6221 family protein n=1 Tax=Kitasatospora phosalacinea TaxID=2065 RepID=A0ABW6GRD2_9ACTN